MTMLMERETAEQVVPFGARGLTAFVYSRSLPEGTTLCPDRQVAVLPGGALAVTDNDLMMVTGCWETTVKGNENKDYHGDD